MRTLEAIAISKTIIDNVDEYKQELSKEMSKNGFVCVDGIISQYNPVSYDFVNVNDDVFKPFVDSCIKNKWAFLSNEKIISYLKESLPQLTEIEVMHFKEYITQYQTEIDTEFIKNGLNEALQEYSTFDKLEVTIKNGRDLTNQLIIMKQNRIFANTQSRYLFKYKDGDFQIYNLNDLMGLFNSYLANKDIRIKPSDLQRNRKTYLESLTDIRYIMVEVKKNQLREDTLERYADDYKKILKLIKGY